MEKRRDCPDQKSEHDGVREAAMPERVPIGNAGPKPDCVEVREDRADDAKNDEACRHDSASESNRECEGDRGMRDY